jgi:hypothetical protein
MQHWNKVFRYDPLLVQVKAPRRGGWHKICSSQQKNFGDCHLLLFREQEFHVIVVLAEAVAPMKLLIHLDRYRQSTPEYRHDCSWATSALFQ